MPKPSKRVSRAKKAGIASALKRKEGANTLNNKINPRTFAFAILANGGTYTYQKKIMNDLNIKVSSSSSFYNHQKVILHEAKKMAEESMLRARNSMSPHSSISFDGHYSHYRNANECGVDVMDERGLIIQHEIKTRIGTRRKGNYIGPSNMMESSALRDAMKKLDINCFDKYVHDRDNKSKKIMEEMAPGKTEYHDPNHALKGYNRCWKKLLDGGYRSKTVDMKENQGKQKPFHGLGEKLKTWFCFLLYSIISIPKKNN